MEYVSQSEYVSYMFKHIFILFDLFIPLWIT